MYDRQEEKSNMIPYTCSDHCSNTVTGILDSTLMHRQPYQFLTSSRNTANYHRLSSQWVDKTDFWQGDHTHYMSPSNKWDKTSVDNVIKYISLSMARTHRDKILRLTLYVTIVTTIDTLVYTCACMYVSAWALLYFSEEENALIKSVGLWTI